MDEMETIRVKSWLEHLILIADGHIKRGFDPEGCAICEEIRGVMDTPTLRSDAYERDLVTGLLRPF